VNYLINILPGKYYKTVFTVVKSYMAVRFNYFLSIAIFLNTDISQGSVATYLRCDELLYYTFIIHSPGERIFKDW